MPFISIIQQMYKNTAAWLFILLQASEAQLHGYRRKFHAQKTASCKLHNCNNMHIFITIRTSLHWSVHTLGRKLSRQGYCKKTEYTSMQQQYTYTVYVSFSIMEPSKIRTFYIPIHSCTKQMILHKLYCTKQKQYFHDISKFK